MSDVERNGVMVLITASFLAVFFLGFYIGDSSRRDAERALAIEAGVGWYESDPATGQTSFYYGKPPGARP